MATSTQPLRLFSLILFLMLSLPAAAVEIAAIGPPDAIEGEIFGVLIAGDFSGDATVGGGVTVQWDATAIRLDSFRIIGPGGANTGDGSTGQIELGIADAGGYSGTGAFATLTFTGLSAGSAGLQVSVSNTYGQFSSADGQTMNVTYAASAFDVVAADPCAALQTQDFCDERIRRQDAEVSWRYVGVQPDGTPLGTPCPLANGWTESKVFGQPGAGVIPELDPYCLYTDLGGNADPDVVTALVTSGALEQADPDIMAVTFADGPLSEPDPDDIQQRSPETGVSAMKENVRRAMRDFWLQQTGANDAPGPGPNSVRLSILDTMPTLEEPQASEVRGKSGHGHALVHLADDVLCGDPYDIACNVEIVTNLALPRTDATDVSSIDLAMGGTIGSPIDVGLALEAAMRDAGIIGGGAQKLVINMSLGWNERFNRNHEGFEHGAVRALRSAFRVAACRGVVIVASSGNPDGGQESDSGPLYPAGFESDDAPGLAQCNNVVLPDGAPASDDEFPDIGRKPLVYAAGAVRSSGRPVQARRNSEPLRVAFGDHGVGSPLRDIDPLATGTITGTSGGALVVSSAAALTWTHLPSLPGWELMRILDASRIAVTPARNASFCPSGVCQPVGRVDLCHVVQSACALKGGCTLPLACPPAIPYRMPRVPFAEIDAQFTKSGVTVVDLSTYTETAEPVVCQRGGRSYTLHSNTTSPRAPCPHLQFATAAATPWTDPQPGSDNCEDCSSNHNSPGTLYIEIDELLDANADTADAFVLTLFCNPTGSSQVAWRLGMPPLQIASDRERLKVTNIPTACEEEPLFLSALMLTDTCVNATAGEDCASIVMPLNANADRDSDTVPNSIDNCTEARNVGQIDSDGDGYGNACDADFDNNCIVDLIDLALLREAFFGSDDAFDFNRDGVVNVEDLGVFRTLVFGPPGPSAVGTLCEAAS